MRRLMLLSTVGLGLVAMSFAREPSSYRLVPDWAKLPDGWVFGHPRQFPLPEERDRARAESERARAEAIAKGETPPPRQETLQPGISGIAIDSNDHIFVFHRGKHPVIVLDREGNYLRSGADGITGAVPHFIKVDPEGQVWVVDEGAHRVLKLNREMNEILLQIGVTDEPGYDPTHLDRPADVAITKDGEILIADGYGNNRIAKYSKDGKFLKQWGGGPDEASSEEGRFHLPHAVLVDTKNRVFVLDRENRRIQMFDTDGKFLGKMTDFGYAWGMAFSPDEKFMFITEHESEQVVKLSMDDGTILERWGGQGRGPGQFDWAHGLVVDSQGAVYVGDTYGQRIQKFVPLGATTESSR